MPVRRKNSVLHRESAGVCGLHPAVLPGGEALTMAGKLSSSAESDRASGGCPLPDRQMELLRRTASGNSGCDAATPSGRSHLPTGSSHLASWHQLILEWPQMADEVWQARARFANPLG